MGSIIQFIPMHGQYNITKVYVAVYMNQEIEIRHLEAPDLHLPLEVLLLYSDRNYFNAVFLNFLLYIACWA